MRLISALLALAALVALAGCSLIGLGIGAIVDDQKPDSRMIPGYELTSVKKDTNVILRMKDGSSLAGEFAGLEKKHEDDYASAFADANRHRDDFLPDLGESVVVEDEWGTKVSGHFAGLDVGAVVVGSVQIPAVSVRELSVAGETISGDTVRAVLASMDMPLRSRIVVRHENYNRSPDLLYADFADVSQVEIKNEKNGMKTGFLIGLVVDAVVIAVALSQNDNEPTPADTTTISGCPYARSWDGREWRVEGECFSGSIFQAAARTDFLRLAHLAPVDGACRVRISDELPETDFVDEATLLVVDHPMGTTVVPSFAGEMHTLRNARPPTKAEDLRGADVTELIARPDGRAWVSNPFGRRPSDATDLRDGIVLEFVKPNDTDARTGAVKLAFCVRNTSWGAYLQSQFVGLRGSGVDAWYAKLNASEEARAEVMRAMVREGMLSIAVWTGAAWRDAGFV